MADKTPRYPLLVCGSRTYPRPDLVMEALRGEQDRVMYVVEGGADGADRAARDAARTLRVAYKTYPANWRKYGVAAGALRNTEMLLREPGVREVWAFVTHGQLHRSPGTLDMVTQALVRGKRVRVYGDRDLRWRWAYLRDDETVELEERIR